MSFGKEIYMLQWAYHSWRTNFIHLIIETSVWTHYKIGKLNMWTLFCNVCIKFLKSQIWKDNMLELNDFQVLPCPQLIFPSKT